MAAWATRQQIGTAGSAKAERREPISCLGRVFNLKLGSYCWVRLEL